MELIHMLSAVLLFAGMVLSVVALFKGSLYLRRLKLGLPNRKSAGWVFALSTIFFLHQISQIDLDKFKSYTRPATAKEGEYDWGFKGAIWGTTPDEVRKHIVGKTTGESVSDQWELDLYHSVPTQIIKSSIYSSLNQLTTYKYRFWQGVLAEVTVSFPRVFSYEEILKQIESQYGPPQSETEGHSIYVGDQAIWRNNSVTICLYSGAIQGYTIELRINNGTYDFL